MFRRFPPAARAAAALLLLAAQASGVLHLAVAEHGRCLEHGELIDVTQTGAPVSAAPAAPSAGRSPLVRGQEAPAAEDEHCLWLACARASTCPDPGQNAAPVLAAPDASVAPPDRTGALAGEAVFRIAPKNSPPV